MFRPYAASYECGRQLVAAGIPLDYLQNLPRKSTAARNFYVRQLTGYADSRLLDFGAGGTAYLIPIAVGTDRPGGITISEWSFVPPWKDPINWEYDVRDIVPEQDYYAYEYLFDSYLSPVLNDRRLLTRGRPVEGLLFGRAYEPIPEAVDRNVPVQNQILSDGNR